MGQPSPSSREQDQLILDVLRLSLLLRRRLSSAAYSSESFRPGLELPPMALYGNDGISIL